MTDEQVRQVRFVVNALLAEGPSPSAAKAKAAPPNSVNYSTAPPPGPPPVGGVEQHYEKLAQEALGESESRPVPRWLLPDICGREREGT